MPPSQDEDVPPPPPQELEVIRLIAAGYKDYAIARRLGVSVVTVRRRVSALKTRVGARSRPEAVARAAALGWLEPGPDGPPATGEVDGEGPPLTQR